MLFFLRCPLSKAALFQWKALYEESPLLHKCLYSKYTVEPPCVTSDSHKWHFSKISKALQSSPSCKPSPLISDSNLFQSMLSEMFYYFSLYLATTWNMTWFHCQCMETVYWIMWCSNKHGEQGWRSSESTRLPPMWPRFNYQTYVVSYVGWICCWFSSLLLGFFSGYSGFSPSTKTNIFKFQFDLECTDTFEQAPRAAAMSV